jgi:hypothetical protein
VTGGIVPADTVTRNVDLMVLPTGLAIASG